MYRKHPSTGLLVATRIEIVRGTGRFYAMTVFRRGRASEKVFSTFSESSEKGNSKQGQVAAHQYEGQVRVGSGQSTQKCRFFCQKLLTHLLVS